MKNLKAILTKTNPGSHAGKPWAWSVATDAAGYAHYTNAKNDLHVRFKSDVLQPGKFYDVATLKRGAVVPQTDEPSDFLDGARLFREAREAAEPSDLQPLNTGQLLIAMNFIAKDDLRPAMKGVYYGPDVVATDAHMIFSIKNELAPADPYIIPEPVLQLVKHFRRESWTAHRIGENVCFTCDALTIIFRPIDERYPDYKAVIPVNDNHITLDRAEFTALLKGIKPYTNKRTGQIAIDLAARSITAQDEESGADETRALPIGTQEGDGIKIGFNVNFLIKVLRHAPKSKTVKISYSLPERAVMVNDHFLVMPILLNR